MWTTAITFAHTSTARDEDGFLQQTEVWGSPVRASKEDITRQDEILASQYGYHLETNFRIQKANYGGESYLKDAEGEVYEIKRTYTPERSNYIILACAKRERRKAAHDG